MASPDTAITEQLASLDLAGPVPQHDEEPLPVKMVDTPAEVKAMLDTLTSPASSSSALYIDLEGVNLSCHGSVSLMQIFAPPCDHVYMPGRTTLKHVLESAVCKKHVFDVRNDADALHALFGIRLTGVVDVQLLELASRTGPRHVFCGLAAYVEPERVLTESASQRWQSVKSEGKKMFDPKSGGSHEVFNTRLLPQILVDYCVADVRCLPALSALYQDRLNGQWAGKVVVETAKRLEEARSPGYQATGKNKVLGPKQWRFLSTGQVTPGTNRQQQGASQATMRFAGSSSSGGNRQSRTQQVSGGRNTLAQPSSAYIPGSEMRTGAGTPVSGGGS